MFTESVKVITTPGGNIVATKLSDEPLRISFKMEPQGVVTDKPLKVSNLLALK